ncbi:hypothetical protein PPACK8108_LOCUS21184 [Phakopsora pachyrhizi]|uniref:Uncharacterized protein n=1 Tax=Phakopsora pachyrhizi TaxID=170000 RepID=A0AAV0BK99_PHAPC|nr:hypothetical protein PPACK8108_LOCUS21184 [Phakopsora pachyrhizi]
MGKERRRNSLVGLIRKLKAPRRQSLNFYNKQQVSQRSSWAPSANSTENNKSSLINSSRSVPYLRASRVPVIDGKNFPATTMTSAAKMVTKSGNMSLSPRKMRSSSGTTKKFGRRSLAIGGGG